MDFEDKEDTEDTKLPDKENCMPYDRIKHPENKTILYL